jgi:hypothetical protein
MPRALSNAQYRAFLAAMVSYVGKVKARRALKLPKMVAKSMPSKLADMTRRMTLDGLTGAGNNPFYASIAAAMLGRYRKLHLKQGTHKTLKAMAKKEKGDLSNLFKIHRMKGETDEVTKALELLALESHHVVPAASFSRFRAIEKLYDNVDEMQAVLITTTEHTAGVKRLVELVPNGGVGVLLSKESITSAINEIVFRHKRALDSALSGVTGPAVVALEKSHATAMIDDLIDYYRTNTPQLLGSGPGSVHDTLLNIRRNVAAVSTLKPP